MYLFVWRIHKQTIQWSYDRMPRISFAFLSISDVNCSCVLPTKDQWDRHPCNTKRIQSQKMSKDRNQEIQGPILHVRFWSPEIQSLSYEISIRLSRNFYGILHAVAVHPQSTNKPQTLNCLTFASICIASQLHRGHLASDTWQRQVRDKLVDDLR